ncbi:30S ribosomal protein S13 [Candidatus Uhrbacteria bacterium CG10_big_fil_rev_8_21_14_0_10_48_11]|uniref:Small ribosomal subunit protein uS13 n=1 Tax=Candidatus Uhrbacteria bacterium CG10_big_fil_rev_8_21_14_0_10_48_11 TaxID=1975037 RepID=A0A2M8LEE3_9BACT|nr:MAG: 30S ribosomal protein S13 [Candidatus Uhrbacteria bacterium CG10_big_fil_rev_8_21_14_0_10_48_11]
MARIAGVTIPNEKRIEVALTYIYGIGLSVSKKILSETKINVDTRTKDLLDDQVALLREYIEKKLRVEGDLRREVIGNIMRIKDIGSYRGSRHAKHLPARGQRTKTNTRTVRGNVRRTMGSGKRTLAKT